MILFWLLSGDMKKHLAQKTDLEPEEQRLFFRGMEKADEEHLDIAGVKNNSKVLLLEARKESKVEEVNQSNEMPINAGEVGVNSKEMPNNGGQVGGKSNVMSKASHAIAEVIAEVDKLAERVSYMSRLYLVTKMLDWFGTHNVLFDFKRLLPWKWLWLAGPRFPIKNLLCQQSCS